MIKIICLLLLFSSLSASAQSYLEFVENKGQWKNEIKYQGMMVNGAFALQPSGYRIMLSKAEDMKAVSAFFHGHKELNETTAHSLNKQTEAPTIHSHSYEVKFLGANENATIIPEKPIETYNNYFIGNDKSKWASNCKIFQAITYKNIYPNIDVRYYTNNNHLKYDIIVNPGGDPNKIAMYFDGVDGLKTKNGDLIIKTSVGEIKELAPYSYQLTKTTKKEVACSYFIKGNIVRFKTEGDIDKSATLVIDPTLIFSTFTGSTIDNWGYTATYDDAGNFYAGGIAFGAGFPVSNGAFQTTFQGGSSNPPYDIAIMKFNSAGTNRIYATYLGGNGDEQPHSLIVDNGGNLIIAGRTNSSNYPVTQPTYGSGGKWDIILTKLNAAGTALIASRKFGGIDDDGVNIRPKYPATTPNAESIRRNYGDDARSEVIIDNSGNIYLASCTQSIDFIKTAGAAQTIPGNTGTGRYQDGVVIKTSPDLANVLFSTLIGGTGDDAAFVLAINPMDNNIYVAGGTTSTDMPGNFTGSIFPTYQGGIADGFMQVLSNDGASFLKSTYLGTNGTDIVYGVQFDKFGYPYVMGTTTGSWPIINAAYNQPGSKHFIAKLKKDLSTWEYSTIFGGTSSEPKISPFAFLVDRCENVYVSGWGGGINQIYVSAQTTTGLPTTPGAIKPTTDGSDMYFFVMERNAASQLYGSFFGQNLGQVGEHVDGGTSRFDKNGVIYQAVCANCEGGAIFPTTPGVWSETNGTGVNGCNLAAIKIAFNLAGVGSGLQSSLDGIPRDTSGCVPLEVLFRDTIAEGKTYIWRFGDGSPDVTTTVPNTSHIYTTVGVYKVMLVSIDSAKCNISDTSYTIMRVRNDDAPLAFDAIKQQPCNALNYNFVNNSIAPAGKPFKANSFRWDFGDGSTLVSGSQTVNHSYASTGTFIVKLMLIDTNYCNEPDTVMKTLRVAPLVKAKFQTNPSGCAPYNAIFNNTSLAGTDFTWNFGDGTSSTDVNPVHFYGSTGTYIIKLTATDTATCNKIDSTSFTIVVSGKPTAAFTYLPQPPNPNDFVNFTNNSTGGSKYKWLYGDDDSLVTTNINAVVRHLYNASKAYQACLIAYNNFSCSDTTCQTILARVIPAIAIPNAFTPNNDGVNDIVYVNGFGISKMVWRIYNRWGTLLFTSIDKNTGWDGRYKGLVQAQDVYSYGLEVEFSNGEKYSAKGDITLLR